MNEEVLCYAWLRSEENLADIFTKEMKENQEVRDVFIWNFFKNGEKEDNMVVKDGLELKMVNPVNRDDQNEKKIKNSVGTCHMSISRLLFGT